MAVAHPNFPIKTREMHSNHLDSTIWNDLVFRDDDIVISTWAKSGTTWMQQIMGQMLLGPDPELNVSNLSPWLDLRVPPKAVKLPEVEAQTHRRFLKTHLPVDALVFSEKAKYVYIGRDARDVVWSLHHHMVNFNALTYEMLNDTPGLVGPKLEKVTPDVHQFWHDWLENDGWPVWSFWDNVRTWWAIRDLPNVHMVHFNDLKRDMPGEMRRLADFCEIAVVPADWPTVIEYCTFDWMKAHASKCAPAGGIFWEGGAETFINKGTNGRWRDVLSAEECQAFETKAESELGADCAAWLKNGGAI